MESPASNHSVPHTTDLILASEIGDVEAVKKLLENNAETLLTNSRGWNCLHAAAVNDNFEFVKILLDCPRSPDINTQDSNGDTALMLAFVNGNERVVEILMQRGADLSIQNKKGSTCLHLAANSRKYAVFELILSKVEEMDPEIGMNLINAQDGGSRTGNTALIVACERGNELLVRKLLNAGADPLTCNADKYSCVHAAAEGGHYSVLNLLLEEEGDSEEIFSGYDPPSFDALEAESAIFIGPEMPLLDFSTSQEERSRKAAFLKMMGQRLSSTKFTALHLAARGYHLKVVVQLLKVYLALVLKVHKFARHPSTDPLVTNFLLLLSYTVSNRYEVSKKQTSKDSFASPSPSIVTLNSDSKKSKNEVHGLDSVDFIDSDTGDGIFKSEEHDEIHNVLMEYWCSLKPESGSGDWKEVILENFSVKPGEEEYFVKSFVDAYMTLVHYSSSKDYLGRTFVHFIADKELPHGHEKKSCVPQACQLRRVLGVVSVDVNASDSRGDTPLQLALLRGNRCFFRHCLSPGRSLNLTATNSQALNIPVTNSHRKSIVDVVFDNASLYDNELEGADVYVNPRSIEKFDLKLEAFKELERALVQTIITTYGVVLVLAQPPKCNVMHQCQPSIMDLLAKRLHQISMIQCVCQGQLK